MRPPAVPGRGSGTVPTHSTPPPPQTIEPMPRRQPKKSHGLATLVAVSLVVILGATIGGLYVFGPGQRSGEVSVEVEAPVAVTSGDEVTYVVTVSNSDAALDVADLTLEYPVGFLVSSANPPADNATGQSLFRLAPLAAGQRATVSITGRLLGSVGTAAEVHARLDYEPVNFSSSFHVEGAAITRVAASRVSLTFDAPSTAVSPGGLALSIGVENVSDITMNGMEVVLEVPEGVSVTSSTPPLSSSAGELRFDVGTLEPGSSWRVQVEADIVGDGGSRRGLAAAVYQRFGGQRVIVDRALREVEVVQPSVEVSVIATPVSNDSVPVEIRYRNTGSVALDQATVRLRIESAELDWNGIDFAGGRRDGDAVVWDSSSVGYSQLARIEPGGDGVVTVTLPYSLPPGVGATVQLVATLTSVNFGEDFQAISTPLTVVLQ